MYLPTVANSKTTAVYICSLARAWATVTFPYNYNRSIAITNNQQHHYHDVITIYSTTKPVSYIFLKYLSNICS